MLGYLLLGVHIRWQDDELGSRACIAPGCEAAAATIGNQHQALQEQSTPVLVTARFLSRSSNQRTQAEAASKRLQVPLPSGGPLSLPHLAAVTAHAAVLLAPALLQQLTVPALRCAVALRGRKRSHA